MECKFNIGDKVVVVNAKPARINQYKNGDIGVVTQIDHVNHGYVTREDGVKMNVYWDEVEFYKEQPEESTMGQTAERIREDILHIEKRIEEAKKDITSMEQEKNALIEKLKEKGFVLVDTTSAPIQPIVQDIESLEEVKVGETYLVTNRYGCAHRNLVGKEVVVTDVDGFAIELFVEVVNEGSYDCDWMHYKDLAKIKT